MRIGILIAVAAASLAAQDDKKTPPPKQPPPEKRERNDDRRAALRARRDALVTKKYNLDAKLMPIAAQRAQSQVAASQEEQIAGALDQRAAEA